MDETGEAPPTGPNTAFTLFATRDEAMKHRDTVRQSYVLIFNESVRGLSVGAPVDFRGVPVGEVTGINLEMDPKTKEIDMMVYIQYYPQRIRSRVIGPLPVP